MKNNGVYFIMELSIVQLGLCKKVFFEILSKKKYIYRPLALNISILKIKYMTYIICKYTCDSPFRDY